MKFHILPLLLFVSMATLAQQAPKELEALRISKSPNIDGILDEDFWMNAKIAKDFVMFQPGDGDPERENKKTIVKVAYDNEAIYIGAVLFDDNPEDIPMQFGGRDEIRNTDFFLMSINPFNDGQNDYEFLVMSTGAQGDARVSNGREDWTWNAVWDNAVTVNKDNWTIEIKIPYSALRFANTPVQTWGINFHRRINNLNEQYVWNYIDKKTGSYTQYSGLLTNLKDIKPPTRLSFYPYTSGNYSIDGNVKEFNANFGLDIKYGINESFTLDATLIPDFGQTAFDDQVLNLGPFEQMYQEKRAFFTEGTELFDKGRLFYSRRIGNTPVGHDDVEDNLEDNEYIISNPTKVNMINAIKLSGRNKNGLGIGVFNAITEVTSAKIKDTITGEVREIVTEPLTNYNVFVVDQQWNKNSSVSLVNTNVLRSGHFRDANVTGFIFDIADKNSKYNAYGNVKMSNVYEGDSLTTGYAGFLRLSKTHGNIQYSIGHFRGDKDYDIKDLGFQRRENYSNYYGSVSYEIFEPTTHFNRLRIRLETQLNYINDPHKYSGNSIELSSFFVNKKRLAFGAEIETNIGKQNDYYEPRVEGRFFRQNGVFVTGAWVSTDFRKKFATEVRTYYAFRSDTESRYYSMSVEPRYRFSDKFEMIYSIEYTKLLNELSYVDNTEDESVIYFGERDVKNITNALSGKLSFNTKSSLALTFRHYWSPVQYESDFYELNMDGSLSDSNYQEPNDINYNIWNLDLSYSWQFAPGSFLVALYINSIFSETEDSYLDFGENLKSIFKEPVSNVFSLKCIYYIDYNQIKSLFN